MPPTTSTPTSTDTPTGTDVPDTTTTPAADAADLTPAGLLAHARCRYTRNRYTDAINDALERAQDGRAPRLLVIAPPQTGKSLLAAGLVYAWLARHPGDRVHLRTYSHDAARLRSNTIRAMVGADGFRLGLAVADKRPGQQGWGLVSGGAVTAAGMYESGRGEPIHLSVVEDPYQSEKHRVADEFDRVFDAYEQVVETRIAPGGVRVVISSRAGADDLAGRLLQRDGRATADGSGGGWHVVHIPAVADPMLYDPRPYYDRLGREPGQGCPHPRVANPGDLPDSPELTAFWAAARRNVGEQMWQTVFQGAPGGVAP